VSHRREEPSIATSMQMTIDDLARAQHAEAIRDPEELSTDIWESDEELDEFLADLRSSRDA
jgi:hypothetical protein